MSDLEPFVCSGCGRSGFRDAGYGPRDPCARCSGQMLVATWEEWDAAYASKGPEGESLCTIGPAGVTEHRFCPTVQNPRPAADAHDDEPGEMTIDVHFDPPAEDS